MTNYDDDDLDDELEEEQASAEEAGAARAAGSRNFLIALGVLGGLFILVTIVLLFLYFNRPQDGREAANINATNVAIQTANAQTAIAATLTSAARAIQLPSSTPIPTNTPVPAKASPTSVLAQPTETATLETPAAGGLVSPTANAQTQTRSAPAVLTQAVQTQTRQAALNLTATATALPTTGFADEIGLPGLFGMALGLVLLIVLVRRMRFSVNQ